MARPIVRTLDEVHESRVSLNTCSVCGNDIHLMCRKFTGICSELCEKQHTTTIKEIANASE